MQRIVRTLRPFRPATESLEGRLVLSGSGVSPAQAVHHALFGTFGVQAARPNTPVLPFAATTTPSFIDPSAATLAGLRIAVGTSTYVAPQARLDARFGLIEIGSGSIIGDNAILLSNPARLSVSTPGLVPGQTTALVVGDNVSIGPLAVIIGPATIGGSKGASVVIGPGAEIDNATIAPGAAVGALARVGPGVTVSKGFMVRPGANVTTQAEADTPALGKVVAYTLPNATATSLLAQPARLATGYTALYQGVAATGSSAGTTATTVFNGNLSAVEGVSDAPPFTGQSGRQEPSFPTIYGKVVQRLDYTFPARVIGQVSFNDFLGTTRKKIGGHTSIRADEGSPVVFGQFTRIGHFVSITPGGGSATAVGGKISVGNGAVIEDGAVLTTTNATTPTSIGASASIGKQAVVSGSTIGANARVGSRAYVANSTVPADGFVPDGTILINNKVVGQVEW